MADFSLAIGRTLEHEGGYVNDPTDAGGETKYGISKRAYPDVDIAALTIEDAKAIYKRDYWDKVKGDDINSQMNAFSIFDCAVNMGISRASKLAQKVVGALEDGVIGSESIAAINAYNMDLFDAQFRLEKIKFYAALCTKKPDQKKFLLGWINRTLA